MLEPGLLTTGVAVDSRKSPASFPFIPIYPPWRRSRWLRWLRCSRMPGHRHFLWINHLPVKQCAGKHADNQGRPQVHRLRTGASAGPQIYGMFHGGSAARHSAGAVALRLRDWFNCFRKSMRATACRVIGRRRRSHCSESSLATSWQSGTSPAPGQRSDPPEHRVEDLKRSLPATDSSAR
jgi:hypothetical protein